MSCCESLGSLSGGGVAQLCDYAGCSFEVQREGAQALTPDAETVVIYNTEIRNTQPGSFNLATGQWTSPLLGAGTPYIMHFVVGVALLKSSPTVPGAVSIIVYKNGAIFRSIEQSQSTTGTVNDTLQYTRPLQDLTAGGDVYEVRLGVFSFTAASIPDQPLLCYWQGTANGSHCLEFTSDTPPPPVEI